MEREQRRSLSLKTIWTRIWILVSVIARFYALCFLILRHADWFEAGKGPNPELAKLDRDMDDYFKTKQATAEAPAPAAEATEAQS